MAKTFPILNNGLRMGLSVYPTHQVGERRTCKSLSTHVFNLMCFFFVRLACASQSQLPHPLYPQPPWCTASPQKIIPPPSLASHAPFPLAVDAPPTGMATGTPCSTPHCSTPLLP